MLGVVTGLPITSYSYRNNLLVECDSIDPFRLGFGAIALPLGVLTLIRRDEYSTKVESGLGGIAIVLGTLAIVMGLRYLIEPCPLIRPAA